MLQQWQLLTPDRGVRSDLVQEAAAARVLLLELAMQALQDLGAASRRRLR